MPQLLVRTAQCEIGTPERIEHGETEKHGDDTTLISYISGVKEEVACLLTPL